MINIQNYVRAKSLEEAYTLNQKKSTRILGGMLWLKMAGNTVGTAVDLSGLGLDTIEESEEGFRLGAMATLRAFERHPGLAAYTGGAAGRAVQDIVGVQFRNMATVGGSVWGRFGFSDVLTLLLALDVEVELYPGGRVPLEKFVRMPPDDQILVSLRIRRTGRAVAIRSHRNSATDFPVLAAAASRTPAGAWTLTVGARPQRAMRVEIALPAHPTREQADAALAAALAEVPFGSNMRAGADYRRHLAGVLLRRAVLQIEGGEA